MVAGYAGIDIQGLAAGLAEEGIGAIGILDDAPLLAVRLLGCGLADIGAVAGSVVGNIQILTAEGRTDEVITGLRGGDEIELILRCILIAAHADICILCLGGILHVQAVDGVGLGAEDIKLTIGDSVCGEGICILAIVAGEVT